ncbi:MAG: hypothetical protein U5K73_04640 [Halofilum sp. (in: g-proteobacteria)]|nr:hypothetical protein [Halofilum sp. (in: g-proteobacteria)]
MEHVGKAVPGTQALVTLREQLAAAGCRLDLSERVLRTLTRYATDALQPPADSDCMPGELYGADDARDALASAQRVYDTCHSAIAATPGGDR